MESNGEDDHVHLLVEYPPTAAISALVNSVTKAFPAAACASGSRCVPTRDHLWSPSYFAASAGGAPLSIIRQYVEAQRPDGLTALAYPALKDRACASKALGQLAAGGGAG